MADGVLLDTSFLIALSKPAETGHSVAQSYFRHCEDEGILMFLSTIVAAEFYQKQPHFPQALFDAMIVLPFNHDDAVAAAGLDFKRWQKAGGAGARTSLKDDFKLLGQAKANALPHIITADDSTLARYCAELKRMGALRTDAIRLSDGFDKSHWDPLRQRDFDATLGGETPLEPQ